MDEKDYSQNWRERDFAYEEVFDHAWPPSEEEMNRWIEEDRKFLALNENDGSIRA